MTGESCPRCDNPITDKFGRTTGLILDRGTVLRNSKPWHQRLFIPMRCRHCLARLRTAPGLASRMALKFGVGIIEFAVLYSLFVRFQAALTFPWVFTILACVFIFNFFWARAAFPRVRWVEWRPEEK
jgi:hypothetical protein